MKATNIDLSRFEPTVVGAVRRYPIMVLVIALLTTAAAVGYTFVEPEIYRARAAVTVPQTSMSEEEPIEHYLDSQVLLMQSEDVADRAASIANAELNENVLSARDFSGESKSLEIKAPEGEGSYGSSIITVSFTWPSARVAQVGTNAVLQAFDEVRAAAIKAQGEAIVASIEKAIRDPRTDKQQLGTLQEQRTRTLVNQQVDLGRRPTVARAAEPQVPINGNSKRAAAIGLAIGIILGAGLAYARASRRWSIQNPRDPAAIYGAPLIAEIPERRRGQIVSVTDIGEKLVNRSSRRVAAFFGFVSVIAIAFVVIYFAMPSGASFFGPLYANGRNLLLGVFFGLELFIFGIAGARRARKRWTAAADPLPVATDL